MHPSELGSFDSLSTTAARLRSRAARAVATLMVVALVAGGAGLASTRGSPAVNDAMTSHLAVTVTDLPGAARAAAARTVDLTITVPGHVTTVAAMALPHDLAVTTTPIPHGALLTGSVPGHQNFPVTWVGRDQVLGFSIVHLGLRVPALAFAPLPATAAVVAVAPIITDATSAPRFAWADTTLGDPTLRADGAVSYLVTRPHHNLNGVTDALAVNAAGRVVAVLSSRHLWFSAQFVARVANVVAVGNGCHSSLGVTGASAQGGGVLVATVARRGTATGHLLAGDVVTRLAGRDIDSWATLQTVLYLTPAGTPTAITFVRGTATHHAEVILACDL